MRIVHSSELNRVLRGVEVRYYIVTCIRKVLDKRISPRPTFKDIIRPHAGEDVIAVTANEVIIAHKAFQNIVTNAPYQGVIFHASRKEIIAIAAPFYKGIG
jgi:hypothetical protein